MLIPGRKYLVEFDDCCVQGKLVLTYKAEHENGYDRIWEEGVTSGATASEIEPGNDDEYI